MKHFYILLFFISHIVFSQSEQLIGKDWYLTSLKINDYIIVPASIDYKGSIKFIDETEARVFASNSLQLLDIVFNDTNSSFTAITGYQTLGSINDIELDYFGFFRYDTNYTYAITREVAYYKLVITNAAGDIATYTTYDEMFFGRWWNVSTITVDGITNANSGSLVTIGESLFGHGICNDMSFNSYYFNHEYSILSIGGTGQTLAICGNLEDGLEEGRYFSFFMNDTSFSYNITSEVDYDVLVITDSKGNYITYHAATLSITNNAALEFTISPNPFTDNIKIIKQNSNILNVQIYNQVGQKLLDKTHNTNEDLNLEFLNSGVYFLTIQDELGAKFTKKIVK